jgi:hypothetical protein
MNPYQKRHQHLTPDTSPQAPVVLTDATVGQHRMDPVLTGGRQAHQGGPVAQQGPQTPDLLGAI